MRAVAKGLSAVFAASMALSPTPLQAATDHQAGPAGVHTAVPTLQQRPYPGRLAGTDAAARGLANPDTGPALRLKQGTVRLLDQDGPLFPGPRGHFIVQLRGPLSDSQRDTLTALEVELGDYWPDNAYLAGAPAARLAAVRALPFVRALGALLPIDKVPPAVAEQDFQPRSLNTDGSLTLEVYFHADLDLAQARAQLAAAGATTLDEDFGTGHRLAVRLPQDRVLPLLELDGVKWVEDRPPPRAGHNYDAAALSGIDLLNTGNPALQGDGIVLGMWDEGLADSGHPDLAGRVQAGEQGRISAHSTHVAGSMAGSGLGNPSAQGMAPAATLWSYDYFGDPVAEHRRARQDHGVLIANNSWGYLSGWEANYYGDGRWVWFGGNRSTDPAFGDYSGITAAWDRLVAEQGLIVVKSAGNDRNDHGASGQAHLHLGDAATLYYDAHQPDGDYGSIAQIGSAKNVITVGAVDDAGGMPAFSAWGPTGDGRLKPDVVASGVGVYSTYSNGRYTRLTGTSMAAPVVSGALALIAQRYAQLSGGPPAPQVIKALLAQSSRDLGEPGPDYAYGWGLLDARAAVTLLAADGGQGRRLRGGSVGNGTERRYVVFVTPGTAELKVSLAWTDPAASPGAAVALVNDLDLTLVSPDGEVHYPFTLHGPDDPTAPATQFGPNRVDNVEQVRLSDPAPGEWEAVVRGHAVQGEQTFALVSSVDMPPDGTPPGGAFLVLNAGASYALERKVEVYLAGYDDQGINGYFLSESAESPAAEHFTPVAGVTRLQARLEFQLSTGDGRKTVYAWLRDANGNISAPVSATIELDTTPPPPPVVTGWWDTAAGTARWAWSSADGAGRFRYKLNDAVLEEGATDTRDESYRPPVPLGGGRHTLYVQERDEAGHWSATAAATVDIPGSGLSETPSTAPGPVILVTSPVNHGLPRWSWPSPGGSGLYRFRLDDPDLSQAVITSATAFAPPTPLSDGSHTLYLQELGMDGRWSAVSRATAVVDTTPPTTRIGNDARAAAGETWVRLRCEDRGSGCAATYYTTDGSLPTEDSARYRAPLKITATMTLSVLSVDQAGNREPVQVQAYEVENKAATGSGGGSMSYCLLGLPPLLARRIKR